MADAVTLQDAIAELQDAQETAEQAIEDLHNHNTDLDAHPDIREDLSKVLNSGALFTEQQIQEFIVDILSDHERQDFKTAHPGWDAYQAELESQLEDIKNDFATLKDRVDQWYNAQGSSDLAMEIQKVKDKYSASLEALQEAYRQAVENNQDALAEEYRKSIQKTLESQNAEIMAVIEKWQQAQQPEEPVAQIYITFNPNGGDGEMATQYVNQGDTYYYPDCTFTAPEGYAFEKWSSNNEGTGAYTGLVGDPLDTSLISNSVTLYAIWKLVPITEEKLTKGFTIQQPKMAKATIKLVKTMKV